MSGRHGMVNVSRRSPCPVCQHPDWCRVSDDGRACHCYRVTEGPGVLAKTDAAGTPYGHHWLIPLDPSRPRPDVAAYTPPPEPPRADPAVLDAVYRAALDALPLTPAHRTALLARGLGDEEIDLRGYRTLPAPAERGAAAAAARRALPEGADLAIVPGFHRGRLLGDTGLLVPVRDAAGRIVALRIRRDAPHPGDSRYHWLSSGSRGGPGPGAPCHVPVFEGRAVGTVRVTEGELKADIATARTGTLTISVPGATIVRAAATTARALGARRVLLAWDADAATNRHVAGGLESAAHLCHEEGLEVAVETWDPAAGKGLDDALAAGAVPAVAEGADAWRAIVAILRAAARGPRPETMALAGLTAAVDVPEDPGVGAPPPDAPDPPAPAAGSGLQRGDSVELGQRVLDDLRGDSSAALVYDRATFWRYAPAAGTWAEVPAADVYRTVAGYAGAPIPTARGARPLALSDAGIRGAVAAAAQFAAAPGFFNAAPAGVAFRNGFVALEPAHDETIAVLHPHAPEQRALHALPVDYDPTAACDRWIACLRTLFTPTDADGVPLPVQDPERLARDQDDLIAILQEFSGAVLLGVAPFLQACVILQGPGEDGKSVVLRVLSELIPPGARCSVAPQDWGRSFLLAELAGKRLNVVSELPEREVLASERFKAVVTGDALTAERKNKDPFTLVCTAGHLFACNTLPATKDQSHGFWRRPIVLPFAHRFTTATRIRDYHAGIIAEELGGVAAWAVAGALRALAQGEYSHAEPSEEAKRLWQLDADQVRQFVDDCTTPDPAAETTLAELYEAYAAWARETGHGGMSRNALGGRLRGLGHAARSALGRFYRLRLGTDWTHDGLTERSRARTRERESGGGARGWADPRQGRVFQ